MSKVTVLSAALVAGVCFQAHATQVSLGSIGVLTGLGAAPNNNLVFVSNQSGILPDFDCTQTTPGGPALPCVGLFLTDWSAEIHYTDAGGSHVTTDTGTSIEPNNDFIGSPIDGSLPYADNNNACCLSLVTEVIFTAHLSQTSFTICDPNAGCDSSHPGNEAPVFNMQSPFTFDYTPGPDYSGGTGLGAGDAVPLIVTNDVIPPTGVPEPATVAVMIGGILVIVKRKYSNR